MKMREATQLLVSHEDSNDGAIFCEYAKSRGGAQTNFCDGKNLVEGKSSPRHLRVLKNNLK